MTSDEADVPWVSRTLRPVLVCTLLTALGVLLGGAGLSCAGYG